MNYFTPPTHNTSQVYAVDMSTRRNAVIFGITGLVIASIYLGLKYYEHRVDTRIAKREREEQKE